VAEPLLSGRPIVSDVPGVVGSCPTVMLLGAANSVHTRKWARALAERGHQVSVVSWIAGDPLPGVEMRIAPRSGLRRGGAIGALVRFALTARWARAQEHTIRPDVLHIHSVGMAGLLSLTIGRRAVRIVMPWGSEMRAAARSRVRRWLVRMALRRADLVLPTSASMSREVVEGHGIPTARVQTVSWGVDDALFDLATRIDPKRVRLRYGIPPAATVVLSPRTMGPVYRTAEIVTAFASVAASRPDVHLVLVLGQRPAESRALALQERDLANALTLAGELPGRVTVVDHTLTQTELFELMRASDIAVSVPKWDQRSSSVLEAALAGCRLALADIPPYHELMSDGIRADLIGEPVARSLAEYLRNVQPAAAEDQRTNATYIAEFESWSHQIGVVRSLYRFLVGERLAESS
jgi:glycosyltransferase involved in cell wall biosynthesis